MWLLAILLAGFFVLGAFLVGWVIGVAAIDDLPDDLWG